MRRASSRAPANAGCTLASGADCREQQGDEKFFHRISFNAFEGVPSRLGRELNACGIIATMRTPTLPFDRVRAIGFRLLFAAVFIAGRGARRLDHAHRSHHGHALRGRAVERRQIAGDAAIASVFDDMKRIDHLMSTWKEDTEISLVNREGGQASGEDQPGTVQLLQVSVQYSELTHGAFDITYASVGYLYDFKKGVHPDQQAIAKALPGINWRHMVLDPKNTTVYFTRPGMRIDLGGIAKGYSVDRGIEILQKQGITRAMVNAGGDTRIIGDRFGKPWVVGIRDPDHEGQGVPAHAVDRHRVFHLRRLRALLRRRRQAVPPHHRSQDRRLGAQVPQRHHHQRHCHAYRRADQERVHHGRRSRASSSSTRCPTSTRSRSRRMARCSIRRGWRRQIERRLATPLDSRPAGRWAGRQRQLRRRARRQWRSGPPECEHALARARERVHTRGLAMNPNPLFGRPCWPASTALAACKPKADEPEANANSQRAFARRRSASSRGRADACLARCLQDKDDPARIA